MPAALPARHPLHAALSELYAALWTVAEAEAAEFAPRGRSITWPIADVIALQALVLALDWDDKSTRPAVVRRDYETYAAWTASGKVAGVELLLVTRAPVARRAAQDCAACVAGPGLVCEPCCEKATRSRDAAT